MKDYKQITFFLCKTDDLEARDQHSQGKGCHDDDSDDFSQPSKRPNTSTLIEIPQSGSADICAIGKTGPYGIRPEGHARPSRIEPVGLAGPSYILPDFDFVLSDSDDSQIKNDEQVAWSLQEELNIKYLILSRMKVLCPKPM